MGSVFSKILIAVLSFIQIPIFYYCFQILYIQFVDSCPNKDVLSWDADLRFVTTLKLMDHLRNYELGSFLFQVFDSPTWPVLRNLIQMFVFFIYEESQILDVHITLGTLVFLILIYAHVLFYGLKDKLLFPILLLGSVSSILLSKPLIAYSFSAMLEIQGALFFIVSSYYLYWYLSGAGEDKKYLILLSISSFALFQTKYPYGYMFLFSIVLFYILLNPSYTIFFLLRYAAYISYKGLKNYRLIAILVLGLVYALLPNNLHLGKAPGYFKYLVFLLFFAEVYSYTYTNKIELLKLGYSKLLGLMNGVFLPIIIWVFLNPDRFISSGSTLQHSQLEGHEVGATVQKNFDYYSIFFKSLINDAYSNHFVGVIILGFLLLACSIGIYLYYTKNKIRLFFIYSALCLLIILGITFLTPNHQARHIYHLYPSIYLSILLFLSDHTVVKKLYWRVLASFIFVIITSFPLLQRVENKFSDYIVCFTGKDTELYTLPRWVESIIKEKMIHNSVIINQINPNHVNKADTELLVSKISYSKKIRTIVNPKKSKNISNFYKQVFVIGNLCSNSIPEIQWNKGDSISSTLHLSEKLVRENGCIEIYTFSSNKKE